MKNAFRNSRKVGFVTLALTFASAHPAIAEGNCPEGTRSENGICYKDETQLVLEGTSVEAERVGPSLSLVNGGLSECQRIANGDIKKYKECVQVTDEDYQAAGQRKVPEFKQVHTTAGAEVSAGTNLQGEGEASVAATVERGVRFVGKFTPGAREPLNDRQFYMDSFLFKSAGGTSPQGRMLSQRIAFDFALVQPLTGDGTGCGVGLGEHIGWDLNFGYGGTSAQRSHAAEADVFMPVICDTGDVFMVLGPTLGLGGRMGIDFKDIHNDGVVMGVETGVRGEMYTSNKHLGAELSVINPILGRRNIALEASYDQTVGKKGRGFVGVDTFALIDEENNASGRVGAHAGVAF